MAISPATPTHSEAHEPRGDRTAVGLDIGGTKLAASLIDADGTVLRSETRTMPSSRRAADMLVVADELVSAMSDRRRDQSEGRVGLGIAVPELVDRAGRVASEAVIPGLDECDLAHRWAELAEGVIESDVRAAAFAEARLGAGRFYGSFCYVSVGTGISYCFVQDGTPWPGSRGGAILLGSAVMAEFSGDAPRQRWVLEEIASGPALLGRYRELGGSCATVEEVLAMSDEEPAAASAINQAGSALGIGIATLVNLLDPEAVVVGGGLGSAPGRYWEAASASARAHIYWEVARETPLAQAELGAVSGAVGAALIGLGGLERRKHAGW